MLNLEQSNKFTGYGTVHLGSAVSGTFAETETGLVDIG